MSHVAGSAATVLVVDDHEVLRKVIGRELEDAGYRVLLADDGQTAWGLLQKGVERIHLVITDLVMPIMGGVELSRLVATLPSPPPLIFISAYGRGVLSLDRPFLTKPFDSDQLVELVNRTLRNSY